MTYLSPVLHVNLAIQEQRQDLVPALDTVRRVSQSARYGVHIELELNGGCVAFHGGEHQGRDAKPGSDSRVDLCAVGQKELDDVYVAPGGSRRDSRL